MRSVSSPLWDHFSLKDGKMCEMVGNELVGGCVEIGIVFRSVENMWVDGYVEWVGEW